MTSYTRGKDRKKTKEEEEKKAAAQRKQSTGGARVTAGNIKNSGSAWRPNGSGETAKKQSTGGVRVTAGNIKNSGSARRPNGSGETAKKQSTGGARVTAGSIKNSGSAWRPDGSGGTPKKQSTGAFLPVDAGRVTQYAPGSAESIAAFSRLTPEEKLAAGWQGSNAGGGVSAWQPAPAPFAVPDQTKALADMTARAAQGRKTKDWADYTNRLGTGLQTVTSDETQAFRDEVNKSYDEAINAGQTQADQKFYDENDEMYRNQQEVMALYGNLPEEALKTEAGRDVIENAISAGNKYNELVAGNQARQTKVNNIRAQKRRRTTYSSWRISSGKFPMRRKTPDGSTQSWRPGRRRKTTNMNRPIATITFSIILRRTERRSSRKWWRWWTGATCWQGRLSARKRL